MIVSAGRQRTSGWWRCEHLLLSHVRIAILQLCTRKKFRVAHNATQQLSYYSFSNQYNTAIIAEWFEEQR